jgi:hypothetical protein
MPHRSSRHRSSRRRVVGEIAVAIPPLSELVHLADCTEIPADHSVDVEDWIAVSQQLGYSPLNFLSVTARECTGSSSDIEGSGRGRPLVAALYPLNRSQETSPRSSARYRQDELLPFPTYLWMTCPVLKSKVRKRKRYYSNLFRRMQ